jgi:DNA-binding transcriptional regulator YhcF (GntR family)
MLRIDLRSSVPPFEQLRVAIIEQVRSGELAPGSRLPTVRSLADSLGIAPNTVARAYRELERGKVIETRGRRGSFIAATGDASHQAAQRAAVAYLEQTSRLGLTRDEALAIVAGAGAGA